MENKEKLLKLMEKNNGLLTTTLLKENGISREYLNILVKEGKLEKVSRGIYIDLNSIEDNIFNFQYRFKKGIYSHGTALYLHNLTDRTPMRYTMTFPRKYNLTNPKKSNINTYSIVEDKYLIGKEEIKSNLGNILYVYSMERTLCDIVRVNSRLEKEQVINAFKEYVKRNDKRLDILYEYAKFFKVYNDVKKYIEVLL
ncbi:MAG: type IV toxin-antitoxin system AbiEi family antitoxin domain-containing protein [Tenericutes bacterium]|nr:type IV toxin-antitoxin system AbiEi family antitoxin domain-containing protein [Mycoplasmatota bacterium]